LHFYFGSRQQLGGGDYDLQRQDDITARGPETKASEADFSADAEFLASSSNLARSFPISLQKPFWIDRMRLYLKRRAIP
jgi:hypothetical protein